MNDNAIEPVDPATTESPEQALAWLDESITEFFGALEACGRHVQAGTLELEPVQAKVNGVIVTMMQAAQAHTAAMAAAAGPVTQ